MASLQSQKRALRKVVSSRLSSLPPSDIQEQSQAITSRILSSPFFRRSQNVSCYLSMPSGEVDTSALVSGILRAGKTLFVPKIDPAGDGSMDFLKVYSEHDLQSFPAGLWGIKEPGNQWQGQRRISALDSTENLDLILLPGVAFDTSLSRLGHGKGYYDRFISSYTTPPSQDTRQPPLLVGLALREQILEAEQVPTASHDWKMDLIVGPDGCIPKEGSSP